MKRYIWILFSVLFFGVECVYADRMKSYTEGLGQTLVTARTTELGLGNYLEGGAALLLGGSESFTRAWPDLGYDWSAVVDGNVCSDVEVNEKRAKVDVGRVRVVLPKGDDQGRTVGFELIPIRSGKSDLGKDHEGLAGDARLGLEFGELCTLIGDQRVKTAIEASMAFVSSYLAPGVPASGTWKLNNKEGSTSTVEERSLYQMIWSGKVLDVGAAKKMAKWGGKTPIWSLGSNRSVVWRPHSWEMVSEDESGSEPATAEKDTISFDAQQAFTLEGTTNAEFYLIAKKSGPRDEHWAAPDRFTVDGGKVTDLNVLNDVDVLEIWTQTRPALWQGISEVPKIWLVTEKAIPDLSLKPAVYLKGYNYW